MFGPNNKTQVSGNKCTEQDLFFYYVLIEVSVEYLKKKIKNELQSWTKVLGQLSPSPHPTDSVETIKAQFL